MAATVLQCCARGVDVLACGDCAWAGCGRQLDGDAGRDRTVTITAARLGYLLEGLDWRLPQIPWRPQGRASCDIAV